LVATKGYRHLQHFQTKEALRDLTPPSWTVLPTSQYNASKNCSLGIAHPTKELPNRGTLDLDAKPDNQNLTGWSMGTLHHLCAVVPAAVKCQQNPTHNLLR